MEQHTYTKQYGFVLPVELMKRFKAQVQSEETTQIKLLVRYIEQGLNNQEKVDKATMSE